MTLTPLRNTAEPNDRVDPGPRPSGCYCLAVLLSSCRTLGKPPPFPVPQFSRLCIGLSTTSAYLLGPEEAVHGLPASRRLVAKHMLAGPSEQHFVLPLLTPPFLKQLLACSGPSCCSQ